MTAITSWGRLGQWEHDVHEPADRHLAAQLIRATSPGLPFGMGRSYGDVCLNPKGTLWRTTGLDRFIHFDEGTGVLQCESGVLLRDIQRLCVPRGWMLPVTPGTQWVTVGGAIANDVHGKNHLAFGTFGHHTQHITLARTDGEIIECGPQLRPEWFAATVGGLGLTGLILSAQLQLRPVAGPWLEAQTIPFAQLSEHFQLAEESGQHWEHMVTYLDCVSRRAGRGLFMRARPTQLSHRPQPPLRTTSAPPIARMLPTTRLTARVFNNAYLRLQKIAPAQGIVHYEPCFYPLDTVLDWNRIHDPRGFYQYQCVFPPVAAQAAIEAMLQEIASARAAPFLAVLKAFADRPSVGLLSFAQAGVTLAVDFPNNGAPVLALFERFDAIVRQNAGRLYPAKDARMPRALFEAGYPNHARFQDFRDPGISSAMSRRLMGS